MNQLVLVRVLEAQSSLTDTVTRLAHGQRATLFEQPGQAGALDVLHDKEMAPAKETALAHRYGNRPARIGRLHGPGLAHFFQRVYLPPLVMPAIGLLILMVLLLGRHSFNIE
jgi:hypothetical protein